MCYDLSELSEQELNQMIAKLRHDNNDLEAQVSSKKKERDDLLNEKDVVKRNNTEWNARRLKRLQDLKNEIEKGTEFSATQIKNELNRMDD